MLRQSSIKKYESILLGLYKELIKTCQSSFYHEGDLLLCQQNGNIYKGHTCIGPGQEGINSFQQINLIIDNGLQYVTPEDDYFDKYGHQFFQGMSELETSIQSEMNSYQKIWENVYFLRTMAEVVRVANGERYDWTLDMYNIGTAKSNFIRDRIIKKLDVCPKFKDAFEIAYHPFIRNAVAHSQCHVVNGGIWFDNYKEGKLGYIQAIGFADWEKYYIYSYLIFRGIFHMLGELVKQFYFPMSLFSKTGGMKVLAYYTDGTWDESYVFPDETGKVWRFHK